MAEITLKLEGFPHRVNFLTNHPITKELLFPGDVVTLPLEYITPAQIRDGVFQRLADTTPENRIIRDREHIVGVTISEDDYEVQQLAAAAASKVAPGFSDEAKRKVANAGRGS